MNTFADDIVERRLRLGAICSLGALTLLWLGRMEPLLFPIGTVLLTMSMVPLATGFGLRGSLLLGLLFGVLWVAAKLEVMGTTEISDFLNPANAIAVGSIVLLGALSGLFFGLPGRTGTTETGMTSVSVQPPVSEPSSVPSPTISLQDELRRALRGFHDWMAELDQEQPPWPSFDSHLRELLGDLTGAKRVRCYDLNVAGELAPLNGADPGQGNSASLDDALVNHVLVTERRFFSHSPTSGEMIRELAAGSDKPYAWVVPIRSRYRTCGLITAEGFRDNAVLESRLDLAADLAEEFWAHLIKAEGLRLASQIDRPSGVMDRVEILSVLDQTVERCYAENEPVVMLALTVEGIRSMDDGGYWETRNGVVKIIGKTMRDRLRHDDVIGRFSDDRFIGVLRRVDVSLANLIAHKIVAAADRELRAEFPETTLTLRAGLAGSGLRQVPPQELLLEAFEAINEARSQNVTLLPNPTKVAQTAGEI